MFDVAKLVAEQELGYKQIADQLHIACGTLRTSHMPKIMAYFGVHSRLALALEWSKYRHHLRNWESYLAWHRRRSCTIAQHSGN